MVCDRCKMVVRQELSKLGIDDGARVDLGRITFSKPVNCTQKNALEQNLKAVGFEILLDKKRQTTEELKNILIDLVYKEQELKEKLSDYIAKQLGQDYSLISKCFSETEGTTIEKYLISLKIERVKELLMYDELSLKEIAFKLNYSSPAHLSNQFKKATNQSPSAFKKMQQPKRGELNKL